MALEHALNDDYGVISLDFQAISTAGFSTEGRFVNTLSRILWRKRARFNMPAKIRDEDQHRVNSPWNIAASFEVGMDFSAADIAGMLADYGFARVEHNKLVVANRVFEMRLYVFYRAEGERQIEGYLDYFGLTTGYLLSFDFRRAKEPGVERVRLGERVLF